MKPRSYSPSEEVSFRIEELINAIGASLPRHPASRLKLRRVLTRIAATAFDNGRAFEQLQLAALLRAVPHEAREAHAAGLKQGLEACEQASSLDEAKDAILLISLQTAPVHLRDAQTHPGLRAGKSARRPVGLAAAAPTDQCNRGTDRGLCPRCFGPVPTSPDEPGSSKPARERTDWLRLLIDVFGDE